LNGGDIEDSDLAVRRVVESYRLMRRYYEAGRYADVCLGAHSTAYHILRAYMLKSCPKGSCLNVTETNLMLIAVELGVTDSDVLRELSKLGFIHIYFNYPELKGYSTLEFRRGTASLCLKSVEILAYKLLNLELKAPTE